METEHTQCCCWGFFGLGQVHFGDLRVVPEHLSTLPDTVQLRTSKQGQCMPGSPGRAGDSPVEAS